MVCDVCKALCSDHVMTYCRKKWMCPDCFQKWQKSSDVGTRRGIDKAFVSYVKKHYSKNNH